MCDRAKQMTFGKLGGTAVLLTQPKPELAESVVNSHHSKQNCLYLVIVTVLKNHIEMIHFTLYKSFLPEDKEECQHFRKYVTDGYFVT